MVLTVDPLTATEDGPGPGGMTRYRVANALLSAAGYVTYAESVDALRAKLEPVAAHWRLRKDLGKVYDPETLAGSLATRAHLPGIRAASARRASERRLERLDEGEGEA